jgi:hypothetical protein
MVHPMAIGLSHLDPISLFCCLRWYDVLCLNKSQIAPRDSQITNLLIYNIRFLIYDFLVMRLVFLLSAFHML